MEDYNKDWCYKCEFCDNHKRAELLESENTALKLEVEKLKEALNKIRFFNVGQSKPKDRWEEGYDSGCTKCRTLAEQALNK